jgi:hypothetical protein
MTWAALVVGVMALFIFVIALLVRFKFAIPLDAYIAMQRDRDNRTSDPAPSNNGSRN